MHRSKLADDLLRQLVIDYQVDIVLISEQYQDKQAAGWHSDELGTAAIWIIGKTARQLKSKGSGKGFEGPNTRIQHM